MPSDGQNVTRRGRAPSLSEADALLAGLAILGGKASLRLAAEVAGLDEGAATRAADGLIAAGILSPRRPLRAPRRAPLDEALSRLTASARAELHRRAATALSAQHASPEAIADHLLACEPSGEPSDVATLRSAAAQALEVGDAERAVAYLERALAEPPPRTMLGGLLTELGRALLNAGREADAVGQLRRALDLAEDDEALADATRRLARALVRTNDLSEAVSLYERTIDRLAPDSSDLRYGLEADFAALAPTATWVYDRILERLEHGASELPGDTPNQRSLRAVAAEMLVMARGTAAEAARLGRRALAGGSHDHDAAPLLGATRAIWILLRAESFGAAASHLEHTLQMQRRKRDDADVALALAFRAYLHLQTGALGAAAADGREAAELASVLEWTFPRELAQAMLVEALTELGQLDEADRALGSVSIPDDSDAPSFGTTQLLQARGALRLARGEIFEAVADLLRVGHHKRQAGVPNPSGWQWVPRVVPALIAVGREDEARTIAVNCLAAAESWGAPATLAAALGARARTLEHTEARRHVLAALDVLDSSPAILVRWRLRLQLAELDLAAGDVAAASHTAAAVNTAARSAGAALVAAQASELAAIARAAEGGRSTRIGGLSPRELEVTRLVAQGLTDKQIADVLFVSPRTIQSHVGNVLRKTGASTRTELAARAIHGGLVGRGSADH